jgi:hypothetical protein
MFTDFVGRDGALRSPEAPAERPYHCAMRPRIAFSYLPVRFIELLSHFSFFATNVA